MDQLRFYFDYFMKLTRQQISGISIGIFVVTCVISVVVLFVSFWLFEKITGKIVDANKKRALMLMAVYACFIFQIAFYRRFGMEKSFISTRIYFGFRKWDGTMDEKQVVYSFLNVVFFVPWGVLIASAIDNNVRRLVMTFVYSFLTSLSIEILQYFTRTGRSEATDLVTNVLGGMIGCALYIVIMFFVDRNDKAKDGSK